MRLFLALFIALSVTTCLGGRHHEQAAAAETSQASGNPLMNAGATAASTPDATTVSAPSDTGAAVEDLKKADKAMGKAGKEAKKISQDTAAVEDALWTKMKGDGSSLEDAASTLKNDADNLDVYSLEGNAKKYAKKALSESEQHSSTFGLGESPETLQDAAASAKEEQNTARKQTVEMATAYNNVKADAGDLGTLKVSGMDVENLPADVKKDVALLNQLRLDAMAVSKGETAAVETDHGAEVQQLEA